VALIYRAKPVGGVASYVPGRYVRATSSFLSI